MNTPVAQMANRTLIGHGTYVLATVPANRVWIVKFASITNSDLPALYGSVFAIDGSGLYADAFVTALNLQVLKHVSKIGTWVLSPGDKIGAEIHVGNVASVHVAGMVRLP